VEPYRCTVASTPAQLSALTRTLEISREAQHGAGKTHFTVFPEYSIPGLPVIPHCKCSSAASPDAPLQPALPSFLAGFTCAVATYSAANQAAAGLKDGDCGGTLRDKSSPGDWRLPTKDEWSATIARAAALGCTFAGPGTPPSLTNDAGTACLSAGPSSFAGVASGGYWSSSTIEGFPSFAWYANLVDGFVSSRFKVFTLRVWPVRGGPR